MKTLIVKPRDQEITLDAKNEKRAHEEPKVYRKFIKADSVFANFQEDSTGLLNRTFEADWELTKISLFVKS